MRDAREDTVSQTGNGEPGTEEAEALASALNHSAERVQTLWFSFLTFMLYLAVATGTTTHRMLFLEEPLNLPVLNIKLPLLGFYILTPIIFVIFHFYMLLNLVLLARTAKSFEDALVRALPDDGEARETFRMRIENTLFVQLLVGGRLEREGLNAKLLSLIALITLALAPVAVLLYLQIKFLPYHSEAITWLHRGLLALDLALVWTLWPGYRSGWGVHLRPKATWWLVVPGMGSTAALAYAVMVAAFPDEHMYLATDWLHDSGIGAKIAPVNILDVNGEDLIDGEKLARIEKNESSPVTERWEPTLDLMYRDLTGARLIYADVRHVAFGGAILNRADLTFAWARNADFRRAQLQGANLTRAQLQGASLRMAQLQGAFLVLADLQGASLQGAQLQGAILNGARLQGANLDGARLQGANLNGAQLQGANLNGAQLQGANLNGVQLQGASFDKAELQGALSRKVYIWRADARKAIWKGTGVEGPETEQKYGCHRKGKEATCDWTAETFDELKKLIAEQVPEGVNRRNVMERIEARLDPNKALDGEEGMANEWADHERSSPTQKAYLKRLAVQWRELGCAAEGAPYVLHGLIAQLGSDLVSPFSDDAAKTLAAAFPAPDCAGAHGLSEADKAKLKEIAATAPPAPNP